MSKREHRTQSPEPRKTNDERYEAEMKDFERNVISSQEAADLLGISQSRLTHLILEKRIVAKRLGHDWAVYRPSCARYLGSRSGKGRPAKGKPKIKLEIPS